MKKGSELDSEIEAAKRGGTGSSGDPVVTGTWCQKQKFALGGYAQVCKQAMLDIDEQLRILDGSRPEVVIWPMWLDRVRVTNPDHHLRHQVGVVVHVDENDVATSCPLPLKVRLEKVVEFEITFDERCGHKLEEMRETLGISSADWDTALSITQRNGKPGMGYFK